MDSRSRVLILGSMPGPVSLARSEYYGFSGNRFWRILSTVFQSQSLETYKAKIAFVREQRIALWDVVGKCRRVGASDSTIRNVEPNDVARLICRYKSLRTIFLNGRTAETLYRKYFGDVIKIPAYYLPSTSPAHAAMNLSQKIKSWEGIRHYTANRNEWC